MLRVLHVVTDMNRGGIETMLMNYYRHIDRSKLQFDFLEHRSYRAAYDDEIESLGGRIFRVPRLNPFSPGYKQALRNIFINHPEYQVVHCHLNCLSSIVLKIALECGVKVRIAHSHIYGEDKNWRLFLKLYYRRFLNKYATNRLACSEMAGQWMFRGAAFSVLNNVIDASKFRFNLKCREEIRCEWSFSQDELILGHVGRFSEEKNHQFLMQIFAELCKLHPAKLLLVGGGPDEAKIKAKAKSLGILDKVIFAGVRSDVPDLLQAMDVFVFPSLYEGLGMVAIEAQAAGLPCLISDAVPQEAMITDLARQKKLSDGAESWAKTILQMPVANRRNTLSEIQAAGYDVALEAGKLQKMYLDLSRQ